MLFNNYNPPPQPAIPLQPLYVPPNVGSATPTRSKRKLLGQVCLSCGCCLLLLGLFAFFIGFMIMPYMFLWAARQEAGLETKINGPGRWVKYDAAGKEVVSVEGEGPGKGTDAP